MTAPKKPRRRRVKGQDTKIPPSPLALQKIILRQRDGQMVRCSTYSHFSAAFKQIKVVTAQGKVETVALEDVKAIFFVRDFAGDADYKASVEFVPGSPRAGRPVTVTFEDGEIIRGRVLNLAEDRPGFFVFPADPRDNNEKVFVVRSPGTLIEVED